MSPETTKRAREYAVRTTCVVFSSFRRESCGVRNARFELLGGRDASKHTRRHDLESVHHRRREVRCVRREDDAGGGCRPLTIVEGDRLIGMLADREIATRVPAEGRDPDHVKVLDVASKQLITLVPRQDLDEALRMMAKQQASRS